MYTQNIRNRRFFTHFLNLNSLIVLELSSLCQCSRATINQHHEPLGILRLIVFLLYALLYVRIVVEASVLQANFIRHYECFLDWQRYLRWLNQCLLKLLLKTTFSSLFYQTLLYLLNSLQDLGFRFSQLHQFLIQKETQLPATEPDRAPGHPLQVLESRYLRRETPLTLIISLVLRRALALKLL